MVEKCNDRNCPIHGSVSLRGRTFTGIIIAERMHRTATVEWGRRKYNQKYERYERKKTSIKAHNPDCISAAKGDIVEVMECRPLSKTKNFVIIKKTGQERMFAEREEMLAESRVKKQKKMEQKHEEAPAEDAE